MSSDLTPAPDPDAVDAQAAQGADHRRLLQAANAALASSPAPALLECVQTIHGIVLAADPKALRRSVGWFGRLLARDITLQSESEALRSQLGVHVLQARQQLQALVASDRQLQALGLALHGAIDELDRQSTLLAGSAATDQRVEHHCEDSAPRLHHLATLATSLTISASHLDLTVLNHRVLCQRVEQMLPQVELLMDQQRMLRAGLTDQAALRAAASSIETLQGLKPISLPSATPDYSTPDDATHR